MEAGEAGTCPNEEVLIKVVETTYGHRIKGQSHRPSVLWTLKTSENSWRGDHYVGIFGMVKGF